mgnify:FL=1
MQKLVILGGTFNPVHYGHLQLLRRFVQKIGADRALLIPTGTPPHKIAPDLAPGKDRLAMCRLAVQRDGFEVSDIEIKRSGPSYTADTLLAVKRDNPESELYFIMGEDMFLTLQDWYKSELIYSLATICAAPRSDHGCRALKAYAEKIKRRGAKTIICNLDFLPISSTMVRSAACRGENLSTYVPVSVADYIYQHHLYSEESN